MNNAPADSHHVANEARPAFILKLKLTGETQCQVRAVLRIAVDGHGQILYWDAETREVVGVDAAKIESVRIQAVKAAYKAA